MDRVKPILEQSALKTGISTLADKLLSVNETYSLDDIQLQEFFKTKDEKTKDEKNKTRKRMVGSVFKTG